MSHVVSIKHSVFPQGKNNSALLGNPLCTLQFLPPKTRWLSILETLADCLPFLGTKEQMVPACGFQKPGKYPFIPISQEDKLRLKDIEAPFKGKGKVEMGFEARPC